MKINYLKFIITTTLILSFCIGGNAQIKTNLEYDYVSNETNNAGLTKVVLKSDEMIIGTWPSETSYKSLYGCIDEKGKIVVPVQYVDIEINKNANYIVAEKPILVGTPYKNSIQIKRLLLAEDGNGFLVDTIYQDIGVEPISFKIHKCVIVKDINNRFGLVNTSTGVVIPLIYEGMKWLNRQKGYLLAKRNGLWGIVNCKGEEIVSPKWENCGEILSDKYIFDIIQFYYTYYKKYSKYQYGELGTDEGLIAVYKGDKLGFINTDGKLVIPIMYNEDEHAYFYRYTLNKTLFLNGIVILKDNFGKMGAIDVNNKIVVPFEYDELCGYDGFTMWAVKNGKYSIISNKGEILNTVIIPKKYLNSSLEYGEGADFVKYVTGYHNGKIRVFAYYDYKGREIKPRKFEEANLANRHKIFEIEQEYVNKQNAIEKEINLPKVIWPNSIENSVTQSKLELSVRINSYSKVSYVNLSVKGNNSNEDNIIEEDDNGLIIKKMVLLEEGENIIQIDVTNAAGTIHEEKTLNYRPNGKDLPVIEWLDFASTALKQEYQLKLGIKSQSKIEDVSITLNGVQSRGVKTTESDDYSMTVNRVMTLAEGTNRIVVSVRNAEGISTSEKVITYKGASPTPVINEKRIALVVGNSHYSNTEMNLRNPENDAEDVSEKLEQLGFEVTKLIDGSLEQIDKELSSFAEKAKEYDVALFYYAGHGIQSKGVNYILPTNIDNLTEDNIRYKCVDSGRVLDAMEQSNSKLKIVVLDACRNDPVSRSWHRSSSSRGLSLMNAPIGTIIAFSTAPGQTAQDGDGHNSPYTEAFLSALDIPNLDALHFFQTVGANVQKKTHRSQIPWLSSSFTGDFYFNKQ